MQTTAIILDAPGSIGTGSLGLTPPGPGDVVVETRASAISTGTEKLFWTGRPRRRSAPVTRSSFPAPTATRARVAFSVPRRPLW